jgi:HEAT repeat protein
VLRTKNTRDRRGARDTKNVGAQSIPIASRRAQLDWVLAVLDDPAEEQWIKAQAATAAARLCAGLAENSPLRVRTTERLLAAIGPRTKDSVEVGQSAVLALGELGDADRDELDARVRSALDLTASEASDQSMREFALLSLAMTGSRPGGPSADPDRLAGSADVRQVLLHRAGKARANMLPWHLLALGIFEHGIIEAGGSSSAETRAALKDLLQETRSAEIAGACALALGLCEARESSRELIAKLREGDARLRGHAATALGMLGAREAGLALERLLEQARATPELWQPTSEALAALGAPVGRQLLGLLGLGASLESQMNLCHALGRVGDWRALPALAHMACDTNNLNWVRAAATSALGSLGSPRAEPWHADLGHALNFHSVPDTLRSLSLTGLLDLE